MRARIAARWICLAGMLRVSPMLHAQQVAPTAVVRGTVTDAVTGVGITGAVVSLLDADRTVRLRTVTGTRGEFRLARAAGAARLQVLRLGFRPRELALPSSDDDVRITMERLPSLLDGVRVTARASCPARADAAVAFSLWEQARSALLSSVVARQTQSALMRRYRFVRELDNARVSRMTVETDTAVGIVESFSAALTSAGFVKNGFASDSGPSRVYFGPDAEVLLSDAFLDGYCMRLAEHDAEHPERVGVRFTPAKNERDRTEIDGTLWIDTVARSLSHISYEYLLADGRLRSLHPGGQVYFVELSNGTVLIDHWSMRLAGFAVESLPSARIGSVRLGARSVLGGSTAATRVFPILSETGGALAEARWSDDTAWRGTFGALTLRVTLDSAAPAAHRAVRLVRTPYAGDTDGDGVVEFAELIPGAYDVAFVDERLAPIDLTLSAAVPLDVKRGESHAATVRVPTAESFVVQRCKAERRWRDGDLPLVLVRVGSPQGRPLRDARVSMVFESADGGWADNARVFTTGSDGVATLCAGPAMAGKRVLVSAQGIDGARGEIVVTLGKELLVTPLLVQSTTGSP